MLEAVVFTMIYKSSVLGMDVVGKSMSMGLSESSILSNGEHLRVAGIGDAASLRFGLSASFRLRPLKGNKGFVYNPSPKLFFTSPPHLSFCAKNSFLLASRLKSRDKSVLPLFIYLYQTHARYIYGCHSS
jgi:hypothetical protein